MGGGLCDVCLGHVAPPAPVELTAEEREMRMMAKLPSIGEMSDWLREHGFRLVREG